MSRQTSTRVRHRNTPNSRSVCASLNGVLFTTYTSNWMHVRCTILTRHQCKWVTFNHLYFLKLLSVFMCQYRAWYSCFISYQTKHICGNNIYYNKTPTNIITPHIILFCCPIRVAQLIAIRDIIYLRDWGLNPDSPLPHAYSVSVATSLLNQKRILFCFVLKILCLRDTQHMIQYLETNSH
jgi:hypothetical protein